LIMKIVISKIFILLMFLCVQVQSAEYYVTQDGSGSHNGLDETNSWAVSDFNNAALWSTTPTTGRISPGDTVNLCGVISSRLVIQGNGSEGAPITIIFVSGAKLSREYWSERKWHCPVDLPVLSSSFFNSRGLPDGPEDAAIGMQDKTHIIIDGGLNADQTINGIIEATATGTAWIRQEDHLYENYLGQGQDVTLLSYYNYSNGGIFSNRCDNIEIKNLKIINMYNRTENSSDYWSLGCGIRAMGSNISIDNITIEKAFYGIIVGSGAQNTQNIELSNITVTGCDVAMCASMGTDGYTLDNVNIHHNRLLNCKVWDGDLSDHDGLEGNPFDPSRTAHRRDGLKIWARNNDLSAIYSNLRIHHNVIGPGLSRGRDVSGWICMDSGHFDSPEIHHNVFLSDSTDGIAPFLALSGTFSAPTNMAAKIYNNTLIGNQDDGPLRLGRLTSGHEIYNNIFVTYNPGVYTTDTLTFISFWDYNDWSIMMGTGSFQYLDRRAGNPYPRYTYEEWQDLLNFDTHSISENPLFVNINNPAGADGIFWTNDDGLQLTENSPARTAGRFNDYIGAYDYEESGVIPTHIDLQPNYPNPFHTTTTINYSVSQAGNLRLTIYDKLGREIKVLVNEYQTSGQKSVEWDGTDSKGTRVPSGTYFYQLKSDNGFTSAKKMILLK